MSVVMYSTGMCPYCFLAKRLLERRGITYQERRMRRRDRDRLARLGGGLTYPQIVIGDRVVNGFVELRRLEREGELDRIVAGPAPTPG
jgi:glutaredoxin 3